ncbi:very short patch repair endonuclease [Qipengyuania gaetbuli]|uniref:very short patch repair endonuclease n=1 Tax=Qipengyuania gaetbuli TaxID=266952 RepID=UPI001CD3C9AC|nr:very short patch repair endonuclease [Qipengyuania gaetbuli]MCA0910077.1 very short patch repair endonuclease [Qipengyuania gaetbuli]
MESNLYRMLKAPDRETLFADVPEGVRRRMRAVKGKETKPERELRSALHRLGYRFRKNVRKLPGTPDIAFASRQKVIFVHGCFWHQHKGCRRATLPKTRQDYWIPKLQRVVERDAELSAEYEELGWSTLTVWECELAARKEEVIARVLSFVGRTNERRSCK